MHAGQTTNDPRPRDEQVTKLRVCRIDAHLARLHVEAAHAGTKDRRADHGRGAAHHVHDPAAGEVDHTDAVDGVVAEGGEEAVPRPDCVGGDRVNLREPNREKRGGKG